jgi:hypothetical protein
VRARCAIAATVFLAAAPSAPAPALQPAPIELLQPGDAPRATLPAGATIADARLAPDGVRLALLVTRPGEPSEVFLAPADQPLAAASLGPEGRGALEIAWSFGGDRVIVALPGQGDGSRMLRSVPTRPGAGGAIDLTPPDARARIVARSRRRPGQALVAIESPPGAAPDAWAVDLATGRRRLAMRAPTLDGAAVTGYIADRDLAVRLVVTRADSGAVRLRSPAPFVFGVEPLRTVVAWTPEQARRSRVIGFDDDGRLLHCIDARSGEPQLVAIDIETGDAVPLMSAGAPVTGVVRSPTGVCLGVWTDDPDAPFVAIDRSVEPDMQALRAFAAGDIRIVNQSADGGVWLVAYEQAGGAPPVWALFDRVTRTARRFD